MHQFLVRSLSALLFLSLFLVPLLVTGKTGASAFIIFFVILMAVFIFLEYHKMAFSRIKPSKKASILFFVTGFLIFLNGAFTFPSHLSSSFFPSLFSLPFVSLSTQCVFALLSLPLPAFLGLSLASFLFFTLWLYRKKPLEEHWEFLTSSVFGFLYCALPPAFVIQTISLKEGLFWFFLFLILSILHDIFAYLIGKNFGKTKLLPHLSPKKSLEGSFGGFFGAFLGLTLILFFKKTSIPLPFLIGVIFFLSLSCQTGDFFESFLKRMARLKDSGNILPGHGGILDRMDSLCISSYIIYAAALISQTYF